MEKEKGFTLIEILVVLGIVGALLAAIVPLSAQLFRTDREDVTRTEMQEIYMAIFGQPDKGNFGYVGDTGSLPSSLQDLVVKPANIPSFAYSSHNIGYGWRGPYLNTKFNDLKDSWGNDYDFGAIFSGQIRSAGEDHQFNTGDDIVFPFVSSGGALETNGTLQISIFVNNIPNSGGITVKVYYAENGSEVATPIVDSSPADGFKFSVHQGIHAVEVNFTSQDKPTASASRTINVPVIARTQVSQEIFLNTLGLRYP